MNIIKQLKDFSKIIDSNGIDVLYIMVSLMMLNILYFKSTDEYNYKIKTITYDNKKFYTLYLLLENINSILNILDRDNKDKLYNNFKLNIKNLKIKINDKDVYQYKLINNFFDEEKYNENIDKEKLIDYLKREGGGEKRLEGRIKRFLKKRIHKLNGYDIGRDEKKTYNQSEIKYIINQLISSNILYPREEIESRLKDAVEMKIVDGSTVNLKISKLKLISPPIAPSGAAVVADTEKLSKSDKVYLPINIMITDLNLEINNANKLWAKIGNILGDYHPKTEGKLLYGKDKGGLKEYLGFSNLTDNFTLTLKLSVKMLIEIQKEDIQVMTSPEGHSGGAALDWTDFIEPVIGDQDIEINGVNIEGIGDTILGNLKEILNTDAGWGKYTIQWYLKVGCTETLRHNALENLSGKALSYISKGLLQYTSLIHNEIVELIEQPLIDIGNKLENSKINTIKDNIKINKWTNTGSIAPDMDEFVDGLFDDLKISFEDCNT